MALSKKRQVFVNEYIKCWNASEAARNAGYSARTAGSIGHELLKIPEVEQEIQNRLDELTLEADEVLARLGKMARGFDIADYVEQVDTYAVNRSGQEYLSGVAIKVDWDGLKSDGFSHLIKSIKSTNSGITVEWHDQMAALVHIGKHHALFVDRTEATGDITVKVIHERDNSTDKAA